MFEEIIENAYYPMILGSEQGTLAVPDDIEFRPEDYSFHPLMNGAVVLALPQASGAASAALCHLFTRQVWTGSPGPAEPDRGSPSGVDRKRARKRVEHSCQYTQRRFGHEF